jgi:competence protein ComEA
MLNLTFFQLTSLQRRILAVIGVIAVAGSFAIFRHSQSEQLPVLPPAIPTIESSITVDVSGAVIHPGVYSLAANSRVVDAIKAAGSLKANADLTSVNQARILRDGEQIFIDSNTPGSSHHASQAKNGPINVNRATAKELEALPGIGPVLANRIVEYRKSHGTFMTLDELQKVPGIGGSKFTQLKSKITL